MAPDYSEVVEQRAAHAKGQAPSPHALMAFFRESQRGAAVLDELLGSSAWNLFRSNLAGHMKPAEAERDRLREQLEAGALVGDDRAKADLRLQYLRGLLTAFQVALDLPKALIGKHAALATVVAANGAANESGGSSVVEQAPRQRQAGGPTPPRRATRKRRR